MEACKRNIRNEFQDEFGDLQSATSGIISYITPMYECVIFTADGNIQSDLQILSPKLHLRAPVVWLF